MHQEEFLISTLAALAAFFCLYRALAINRKQRLLDDTPISKALGVFVGEVELVGKCFLKDPPLSYLERRPCVQYSWSVIEHWERITIRSTKGGIPYPSTQRGSSIVASGSRSVGFYLQDETGVVWIEPKGAALSSQVTFTKFVHRDEAMYYAKGPAEAVHGSTGYRTFIEHALPIGTTLFVRGRASERPNVVAAQIKHEEKEELFIISDKPESAANAHMIVTSFYWHILGIIAASFAILVWLAGWDRFATVIDAIFSLSRDGSFSTAMYGLGGFFRDSVLLGLVAYLVALGPFWAWMAFNSLIGLRNRATQAYAQIDIQLKRRADLIPPLVACVQGFRGHEASVQTLAAKLRAQTSGALTSAVAPLLAAVVESYPEIRALASFDLLRKNLVDIEDRIALARGYHNNIATFYNIRLERVPDRYLAGLVQMKPEPLFEAEGFTCHPAAVAF